MVGLPRRYDRLPGPGTSQDPFSDLNAIELNQPISSDNKFLPQKTFADAEWSTRKRFFFQASVGLSLLVICVCLWLLFFFGAQNQSPTCDVNEFSLFDPDLVFGNYTLGQVKAIDLTWNTFVGRGSQAIIGCIMYGVITDVLMRVTESTTVPFSLFTALAFRSNQIESLIPMAKTLPFLKGWRATCAMSWIFVSAIYLAVLPTIKDAMTGYVRQQDTFVQFNDGTRTPYSTANTTGTNYTLVCDQMPGYQWGFSTSWVLISLSLFNAWVIGTYGIWLDAQQNSELVRKGRAMGMYRAIADTAEAMTEALGPDTNAYSGRELDKALRKHHGIMYRVEKAVASDTARIKLSSRTSSRLRLSWDKMYGT